MYISVPADFGICKSMEANTGVTIIAAVIIYILLILIFKVFSEEEIKTIPHGEKIYIFLKKIKIYE